MRRAAAAVLIVMASVFGVRAPSATGNDNAAEEFGRARIPHLDGSGRGTIVEIHPSAPGAKEFLREEHVDVPERGEIIVPPTPTPERSPGSPRG